MHRLLILTTVATVALNAAEIRLGIVGTDTSHVIAFTKILNDPKNKDHVPGARVVAARLSVRAMNTGLPIT